MNNTKPYTRHGLVEQYACAEELQPAETEVVRRLSGLLPSARMLDIGVGGGRTTVHFEPWVQDYVGGDFSTAMVDACRRRFGETRHRRFVRIDARDLRRFGEEDFDLVLFSFNGIDEVAREDREQVFKEVKRVLRRDGYFVFSTHNIQNLPRLYSLHGCDSVSRCLRKTIKLLLLLLINGPPGRYRGRPWAIINDGVHRFQLRLHYIAPRAQLEELKRIGFSNIQAFGSDAGVLLTEENIDEIDDPWVYFVCRLMDDDEQSIVGQTT